MYAIIDTYLQTINQKGLLRTLDINTGIDFASNDFLGLSKHPQLIKACQNASIKYGVGSGASRLVSAESLLFKSVENKLANFANQESALLFSTGYMTNLGVISSLAKIGAEFFIDKYCHASIYDGLKLGNATYQRYKHCDIKNLEKKIKKSASPLKIICSESIFSMDGDIAPIEKIINISKKYKALFLLDEAHAIGIYGEKGSGIAEELKLSNKIDIYIGTLGKAMGCAGGFVACKKSIRQLIINNARPFIYSTALPPMQLGVIEQAIKILNKLRPKAKQLLINAKLLRDTLNADTGKSQSHIIPVIIGEENKTIQIATKIQQQGFNVKAIRPPTVPPNTSRLRITIHTYNTITQINKLSSLINQYLS